MSLVIGSRRTGLEITQFKVKMLKFKKKIVANSHQPPLEHIDNSIGANLWLRVLEEKIYVSENGIRKYGMSRSSQTLSHKTCLVPSEKINLALVSSARLTLKF